MNQQKNIQFHYHLTEILGALFSTWGLTVWLVFEAIERLITSQEVDGEIMFIVAARGIVVNLTMACILYQRGVHHHHGLPGAHDHDHCHSHKHKHKHSHKHNHKKKYDHNDHNLSLQPMSETRPNDTSIHNDDDEHNHSLKNNEHRHHDHDNENSNESPNQKNINVRSAFIHVIGGLR